MASKTQRAPQRRIRKIALSDAVLKTNEQLIKSRFFSWALATGSGWPQCAEDVARKTGVKIPLETFRQNFRPTSAKRGERPRSFGTAKYLRAIYDFVCAEGYLSGYTLASPDDAFGAALTLNEYVGAAGSFAGLAGHFRSERDCGKNSYTEVIDLSIVVGKKGGIASVQITETTDDPASDRPLEVVHRQGWMISNNDGMVLLFTKHAYQGAELYVLLQSSPTLWAKTPPDVLAMFRYHSASRGQLPLPTVGVAAQVSAPIPRNMLERSTLILTRVDSPEKTGGARGQ